MGTEAADSDNLIDDISDIGIRPPMLVSVSEIEAAWL